MLDWRDLRIGDLVNVVAWPPELVKDNMHHSTIECYEWLIASEQVLTVERIDSFGIPYGSAFRDGNIEYVALNHSRICRRPV